MKLLLTLFLAFAALCPCSGAVIYTLSGTSPNSPSGPFAVDFAVTTPGFITADTSFMAVGLDSCTTGFEVCDHVEFQPVSIHDPKSAHIEFFTTTTSTLFFFDLGSFSALGPHNTTFGAGEGTLTVAQAGGAVPEPTTIALTFGALTGLLVVRRFRK